MPALNARRAQVGAYDFRDVHESVRFGTASDRYAGWIGQIYPEGRYTQGGYTRTRTVGGERLDEHKLPIASVRHYFEHFSILELDFTFYGPLLDKGGEPAGSTFDSLRKYAEHAPSDARFLLKTPQQYFARTLRRGGSYVDNPDFLDAEAYVRRFHEPAQELLGDRLAGLLFQQEYQRVGDSPSSEVNIEALDGFFAKIPSGGAQAHLELRSDHLLTPTYFDWLAERGFGFVFSHWTWLPPIREQWERSGAHFTAADGSVVARLMAPQDMRFAKAYAHAHPFDRPSPALSETREAKNMVLDAAALAFQAEAQGAYLNLFCSNRAWGNAPALAQAVARRILGEEARRAGGS